MMIHPWTRTFSLSGDDVEGLVNRLLERETPLSTEDLALLLLEQRLQTEREALEARYRDTHLYSPAQTYEVGARLIFPQFEFATATVTQIRDGENPAYGPFQAVGVVFDTALHNTDSRGYREFAAGLSQPHILTETVAQQEAAEAPAMNAAEILEQGRKTILTTLDTALRAQPELMQMAGQWFVRDLLMDVDIGMLHLAEAVLDMNNGGPLSPQEILEQMGGLGSAGIGLQIFSLNLALSRDSRFDEVGRRDRCCGIWRGWPRRMCVSSRNGWSTARFPTMRICLRMI